MTTQHTGDEDALLSEDDNGEEDSPSTAEPAEHNEPEPAEDEEPATAAIQAPPETSSGMDRSLPAPTPFNIDAADLYSEWKHWVSAFEIYAIASDLGKKEDAIQRATMLHCLGPAV